MCCIYSVKISCVIKENKGELFMKNVLLICLMVLLIAGGGFIVSSLISKQGKIPQNIIIPSKENQDKDKQQEKVKEVSLYFANEKYIKTGDESQIKVIAVKRKVNYDKIILAEAAVRELLKNPGIEGLSTGIPEKTKLVSVVVKEGSAYVNFATEGLNGSSLQETLTVEQIVSTLLDLEGINSVQFLKDGKPTEDLMGHLDTSQPFYRKKNIKINELQLGEMKLYTKRDEFFEKIGEPLAVKKDKTGFIEYFDYPDFKVVVTDGEVSQISTTSDKFATPSGVKVGDTQKKVKDIYGEPSSYYRGVLNYKVGPEFELLHIKVKNDKVIEIKINLAD